MPLFEVAVIEEIKKGKGKDKKKKEKLIFGPKPIIAKDNQTAGMKVLLDNQSTMSKCNIDNVKVLVRPFA